MINAVRLAKLKHSWRLYWNCDESGLSLSFLFFGIWIGTRRIWIIDLTMRSGVAIYFRDRQVFDNTQVVEWL